MMHKNSNTNSSATYSSSAASSQVVATCSFRIAQAEDVEPVFAFELKQRFSTEGDSEFDQIEQQISVWSSSIRKESLEHYFKLGWSFIAESRSDQASPESRAPESGAIENHPKVLGFFLGQPLLFVDQQTQTLWIEYLSAVNDSIRTELLDIAYRLAREKHFQRVLLSSDIQNQSLGKEFPFQKWNRDISMLKTTK